MVYFGVTSDWYTLAGGTEQRLTVARWNVVTSPAGLGTKNDCAREDQQLFTRPTEYWHKKLHFLCIQHATPDDISRGSLVTSYASFRIPSQPYVLSNDASRPTFNAKQESNRMQVASRGILAYSPCLKMEVTCSSKTSADGLLPDFCQEIELFRSELRDFFEQ
jgi:hypothetical protein